MTRRTVRLAAPARQMAVPLGFALAVIGPAVAHADEPPAQPPTPTTQSATDATLPVDPATETTPPPAPVETPAPTQTTAPEQTPTPAETPAPAETVVAPVEPQPVEAPVTEVAPPVPSPTTAPVPEQPAPPAEPAPSDTVVPTDPGQDLPSPVSGDGTDDHPATPVAPAEQKPELNPTTTSAPPEPGTPETSPAQAAPQVPEDPATAVPALPGDVPPPAPQTTGHPDSSAAPAPEATVIAQPTTTGHGHPRPAGPPTTAAETGDITLPAETGAPTDPAQEVMPPEQPTGHGHGLHSHCADDPAAPVETAAPTDAPPVPQQEVTSADPQAGPVIPSDPRAGDPAAFAVPSGLMASPDAQAPQHDHGRPHAEGRHDDAPVTPAPVVDEPPAPAVAATDPQTLWQPGPGWSDPASTSEPTAAPAASPWALPVAPMRPVGPAAEPGRRGDHSSVVMPVAPQEIAPVDTKPVPAERVPEERPQVEPPAEIGDKPVVALPRPGRAEQRQRAATAPVPATSTPDTAEPTTTVRTTTAEPASSSPAPAPRTPGERTPGEPRRSDAPAPEPTRTAVPPRRVETPVIPADPAPEPATTAPAPAPSAPRTPVAPGRPHAPESQTGGGTQQHVRSSSGPVSATRPSAPTQTVVPPVQEIREPEHTWEPSTPDPLTVPVARRSAPVDAKGQAPQAFSLTPPTGGKWTSGLVAPLGNFSYVQKATTDRGRAASVIEMDLPGRSWDEVTDRNPVFAQAHATKGVFKWSVPLTMAGSNLQDVATGRYDQQWDQFSSVLAGSSTPVTVRLTMPADADPAAAKAAFRRVAQILTERSGRVQIEWVAPMGTTPEQAMASYPGSDVVTFIGVTAPLAGSWQTAVAGPGGLYDWSDFAQAQGKQIAVLWSITKDSNAPWVKNVATWIELTATQKRLGQENVLITGDADADAVKVYRNIWRAS